ncbi:hypothetical protein Dvina_26010 [Dactylosporangium vinaceum]|uniref:Protoporphyrinogen oxidase n=1 Tax=Dactylosporangium vinaceum TaxID=53362 RepID=A0ABV5M666_9ACTN|nr:hypothetical protein [Dactylosporangium vinaceum]UAC02493.1 hypothetical protein Dvina_26010 [Dactylosporangium vinaceum]
MRLLTVAAGVAVGYVLGTRAGREKYDQIVASTGRLRANPTAGQAVQTVQELFTSPTPTPSPGPSPAVTATPSPALDPAGVAPKPRKRTPAKATTKPITPETASDLETPV